MNLLDFDARVFVYVGMFGSGKTEMSINSAVQLKKRISKVALIDLDTISPYFRSRDEKNSLESMDIKVITPPGALMHADLPIVTAQVGGYLSNKAFFTVADVGGNEDGATVLGSLKPVLDDVKKKTFFVINTLRPFSSSADEIVANVKSVSGRARTGIDYLINNTNVGSETSIEDVERGEKILEEVSQRLGIPVAFTSIDGNLDYEGRYPVFKLERYMKNPW